MAAPALIVRTNASLAVKPPSKAVTLTLSVPTLPLVGVPLNVRVEPLNDSQAGSAASSPSVAK